MGTKKTNKAMRGKSILRTKYINQSDSEAINLPSCPKNRPLTVMSNEGNMKNTIESRRVMVRVLK